jgi:hypothetical protein
MCRAFSGIINKNGRVFWKLGIDSHSGIITHYHIKDDTYDPKNLRFAKFEITPKNNNYLYPNKWTFRLDESVKPLWWNKGYEQFCFAAKDEWYKELEEYIVRKPIIHPFMDIKPPKKITGKHLDLLRKWSSVRSSVGSLVRASVGPSVGASVVSSVWASVWASVWPSVGASVVSSVWALVWPYTGSFFKLPKWGGVKHKKGEYPFQVAVDLWEMGLVPSSDVRVWRLYGGKDGGVLWEGKL